MTKPNYIDDFLRKDIHSGDGHGWQGHELQMFSKGGVQLPICALPGRMPGQTTIQGIDGDNHNLWVNKFGGGVAYFSTDYAVNEGRAWTYANGGWEKVVVIPSTMFDAAGSKHLEVLDSGSSSIIVALEVIWPFDTAQLVINISADSGYSWMSDPIIIGTSANGFGGCDVGLIDSRTSDSGVEVYVSAPEVNYGVRVYRSSLTAYIADSASLPSFEVVADYPLENASLYSLGVSSLALLDDGTYVVAIEYYEDTEHVTGRHVKFIGTYESISEYFTAGLTEISGAGQTWCVADMVRTAIETGVTLTSIPPYPESPETALWRGICPYDSSVFIVTATHFSPFTHTGDADHALVITQQGSPPTVKMLTNMTTQFVMYRNGSEVFRDPDFNFYQPNFGGRIFDLTGDGDGSWICCARHGFVYSLDDGTSWSKVTYPNWETFNYSRYGGCIRGSEITIFRQRLDTYEVMVYVGIMDNGGSINWQNYSQPSTTVEDIDIKTDMDRRDVNSHPPNEIRAWGNI